MRRLAFEPDIKDFPKKCGKYGDGGACQVYIFFILKKNKALKTPTDNFLNCEICQY